MNAVGLTLLKLRQSVPTCCTTLEPTCTDLSQILSKDLEDASTLLVVPWASRLPAALGRDVAPQAGAADGQSLATGTALWAAGQVLDILFGVEGVGVVAGVDGSAEGEGGEEEGGEAGEEVHVEEFLDFSKRTVSKISRDKRRKQTGYLDWRRKLEVMD